MSEQTKLEIEKLKQKYREGWITHREFKKQFNQLTQLTLNISAEGKTPEG